jgi:hypothetical protein
MKMNARHIHLSFVSVGTELAKTLPRNFRNTWSARGSSGGGDGG